MTPRLPMMLMLLCGLSVFAVDQAPAEVDPKLPAYEKVSGITGNISSVGSDTLNNLMALWSEGFRKLYPNVNLQVEGKGSSTAPPALIEGIAQLGPMSRPMKAEEIESFERRKGYKPTPVGVALDALAIFVHKDNPLEQLSMPELDAIFSATRRGGHVRVRTWGQLTDDARFREFPISLYGRNSASGTYGFFKKHALFKGDFKPSVKEQPGSSSVVMGITEDRSGIGYSGIGYLTSGVKTLRVSTDQENAAYAPTPDNVISGDYPLGRMLIVYVDKPPNRGLPSVVDQFLSYVLSKEGQEIVAKSGYIPLPSRAADYQLQQIKP